MVKVLIGNRNVQDDLNNLPFLNDITEYSVITSNTGNEIIDKCKTINPNIIMLNTNILDMSYTDIIEELSNIPEQLNKCNLILTVNTKKEKLNLKHVAIISDILESPVKENDVKPIVNVLKMKYNVSNITFGSISRTLRNLGLNVSSGGGQYLTSTILHCYNDYNCLETLKKAYNIVAKQYGVSTERIKDAIRHTIDKLNHSYNLNENPLFVEIFGNINRISAKAFIQTFVDYLHETKN